MKDLAVDVPVTYKSLEIFSSCWCCKTQAMPPKKPPPQQDGQNPTHGPAAAENQQLHKNIMQKTLQMHKLGILGPGRQTNEGESAELDMDSLFRSKLIIESVDQEHIHTIILGCDEATLEAFISEPRAFAARAFTEAGIHEGRLGEVEEAKMVQGEVRKAKMVQGEVGKGESVENEHAGKTDRKTNSA